MIHKKRNRDFPFWCIVMCFIFALLSHVYVFM